MQDTTLEIEYITSPSPPNCLRRTPCSTLSALSRCISFKNCVFNSLKSQNVKCSPKALLYFRPPISLKNIFISSLSPCFISVLYLVNTTLCPKEPNTL